MISNKDRHRERMKQSAPIYKPQHDWWCTDGAPEQTGAFFLANKKRKIKNKRKSK